MAVDRLPTTRRRDQYVVYIHWDAEHESPPLGPFENVTAAKKWVTEFRKTWNKQQMRKPMHERRNPPKTTTRILRDPAAGISWAYEQ